jgi:predicted nucleic-acid-binding protein
VTALLDTDVLIRHFTGDPPDQAARATARIGKAGPNELLLLDLHVAECVYVLEGPYRQPRGEVFSLLRSVLGVAAVQIENEAVIRRSLDLYVGGLDFADAYLVARAEDACIDHVLSFDRFDTKLRKGTGVRRLEP